MKEWFDKTAFTYIHTRSDVDGRIVSKQHYGVSRRMVAWACVGCVAWGFFTDLGRSLSQALISVLSS